MPGGRSIPACFDRATGEFLYFHLAQYGKSGGSSVYADDKNFFGHDREGVFQLHEIEKGERVGNAQGRHPIMTEDAYYFAGDSVYKRLASEPTKTVWKINVDASGDLIKAGNRLYAAGKKAIIAIQLPEPDRAPKIEWSLEVDGEIARLLAADDRLFAVTRNGSILAFGETEPEGDPATVLHKPIAAEPSPSAQQQAKAVLDQTGVRTGYALVYGASDGGFLEALALNSQLRINAVVSDATKIEGLRQRLTESGLYGSRIALHAGDLESFLSPAYMSSLTIVRNAEAAGVAQRPEAVSQLFHSLRPYGGVAWLELANDKFEQLSTQVASAQLSNANVKQVDGAALLSREGALEGAGVWTHQYGDAANTVKSNDSLVKLPLGVLWFGGSSNMDVLPRHGHGPPEQVIGGRLFIQGMDVLSARDVYTGRILWQIKLRGLKDESFGLFYDDTYKDTPLSQQYNQVHIPGANARGTNFVATTDRVYIVQGQDCRVVDAETGKTLGIFWLEDYKDGQQIASWGYIAVENDKLIAGADFAEFSERLKMPHEKDEKRASRWRFVSRYSRHVRASWQVRRCGCNARRIALISPFSSSSRRDFPHCSVNSPVGPKRTLASCERVPLA